MQLRLREVGFEPGPADGFAGEKTKAAFTRFQSGCAKIASMIEAAPAGPAHSLQLNQAVTKVPNWQETYAIQAQLRAAGFNPGPVDGIFGDRTRSLLVQLKAGCPTVGDFTAMFDHPAGAVDTQRIAAPTLANNPTNVRPMSTPANTAANKPVAGSPPVPRSQEEIRLLQLRLQDAGFDPGPFDGVMGAKTKVALEQYQEAQRQNKAKLPLITGSQY
jgi:peptidoglycan hydrolase-like protein with peptidoglycan-binding domain